MRRLPSFLPPCYLALVVLIAGADVTVAETVTVYRDAYGVPHIYAETLEGAAYAAGYAQAEDRLEEMLRNYRKAAGTMSEVMGRNSDGKDWFRHDYIQRVWRHESVSREKFPELPPKIQAVCRAYIDGVKKFMAEHPEQVPAWAPELAPYYPIMLSRYIIYGWPLGQAFGDLQRGGIQPEPLAYRGSNEWVVAPSRTKLGAAIAVVDPHLSWYGEFRFYEQRMYASKDDAALSGACILGVPMPGLGHSQYASIAMTTGGPDTSDVYEETLNPDNPLQYQVDGEWRDVTVRQEVIRVKTDEGVVEQQVPIAATHHGPIVARKEGKAYTMAIPYAEEVGLMEELYRVLTAPNLDAIKEALSMRQLMPQNIMVATVDGDIFYVRTGRVPIRNHKLPTDRPVPGHLSENDFAGIHPFEDLVQITNPASGYMQNCNISPVYLMKDSPLTPEKYAERPYLFNADSIPLHQRAGMVLENLDQTSDFGLDEAVDLAFCTQVLGAEQWQERITAAYNNLPADQKSGDVKTLYESIQSWNGRSDPDSVGALAFFTFKQALGGKLASAITVSEDVTDAIIVNALAKAAETMRTAYGKLDVHYGDVFRVGRAGGDKTWPVGGGSLRDAGMATPRAISFSKQGDVFVGRGGQTSTQIVILSKPPKSYTVLPLGESDHPESGHWEDQAEQLFSHGKAKDSFFMNKEALLEHVTSQREHEVSY